MTLMTFLYSLALPDWSVIFLFLVYTALLVYPGDVDMESPESDSPKSIEQDDGYREAHRVVAVMTAIAVGVLGTVFYVALTTNPEPLTAVSIVEIAPLDEAPPALQVSQALAQEQAMPQPVTGYFPNGYVHRVKGETGKVSPFEDD